MQQSKVTILGSNSAISVHGRYPSAQVLQVENNYILIDCGEGTQFRMSDYGIKSSKIDVILISHLHGDHVFGLPGLLTSYQLTGRKKPLTIFGPEPIKKFLEITIGETGHFIDYPITINTIRRDQVREAGLLEIMELSHCKIETFELIHRIECYGYKITEKPKKRKIKKTFIDEYSPTIVEIQSILEGADYVDSTGVVVRNGDCCVNPRFPRSYAYCSDTLYHPLLKQILTGTTTIYHESTYLTNLQEKARERYHSTAREAAEIASGACAEKLILGHYSSRYKELQGFREEAEEVFGVVELAVEGNEYEI